MSVGGPQALASLDEALRDIRREEDEIARRLARSGERVAKIRETEADLVRQLARFRLDPAVQAELAVQLSGAEAKARDMLKAHAAAMGRTEKSLADVDAQLQGLTQSRAEWLGQQGEQQAALEHLASQANAGLANDPAYAAQKTIAAHLQDTASQSLDKTTQAEADRDRKGRPYRDDPLFSYLWARQFGTGAYAGRGLARALDGWVARLIGFAKAQANFALLTDIPLRLREHAEHQVALARQAGDALAGLEAAALDAAGGKPLRDRLEQTRQQIAAIDAQITEAEDWRDTAAKAMSQLAEGADPAFEQALATLAESLVHADIQTLLADARRTSSGRDDTLVAQIDEIRARFKDEDAETKEQRERLKTLAARRRELEDIQWEFKTSRFDDPRSSFGEDRLVGDMLNEFLRGGISAASYWEQWRKSQNFNQGTDWGNDAPPSRANPPWPQGGGQSINWPGGGNPGGSHNGGGFSRPRTGSTGNRSSGGFKTGGGF